MAKKITTNINNYVKNIATNITTSIQVSMRFNVLEYFMYLYMAYMDDFVSIYGEKASVKAYAQAEKQFLGHGKLLQLLDREIEDGDTVVSPGCGLMHEAHIGHTTMCHKPIWLGLEYQEPMVETTRKDLQTYDTRGSIKVWDAYKDSLPKGDWLYLKHFCGGGSDKSIRDAVDLGYTGMVIATCCSHRMVDLTEEVLTSVGICPEEYAKLAKTSGAKCTEKGDNAQNQIDALRCKYLNLRGYTTEMYRSPEMKSGNIIIARKCQ